MKSIGACSLNVAYLWSVSYCPFTVALMSVPMHIPIDLVKRPSQNGNIIIRYAWSVLQCADYINYEGLHVVYLHSSLSCLTHWGRVTHICVGKLTIIGSDNGLSPGRRQVIIWTNAGILLIGPLRTNFSEILSEIHSFSFKKMHLKMSSAKWRPFCFALNVVNL